MQEIFKDIPGYEGKYQVSTLGRVKSFCKTSSGRLLKPWLADGKYLSVELLMSTKKVHVLVALTFIGPRPTPFHDVCHNDGNKTNNALLNLRYDTKSENNYDVSRHDARKISRDIVAEVKRAKGSQQQVADSLGISQMTVSRILRGETRKHG